MGVTEADIIQAEAVTDRILDMLAHTAPDAMVLALAASLAAVIATSDDPARAQRNAELVMRGISSGALLRPAPLPVPPAARTPQ